MTLDDKTLNLKIFGRQAVKLNRIILFSILHHLHCVLLYAMVILLCIIFIIIHLCQLH